MALCNGVPRTADPGQCKQATPMTAILDRAVLALKENP